MIMRKKVKAILKKWTKFEVGDEVAMAKAREGGNMNEDNIEDFRSLNTRMNDYLMVEVVAVPESFQIENHLKMREAAGIFENEKMTLSNIIKTGEYPKPSETAAPA